MGMKEAFEDVSIFRHIATSLSTTQISSRKVVLEILTTTLCYWGNKGHYEVVISALETLSRANGETGPYSYWFHTMETSLFVQYGFGTLDGASDPLRNNTLDNSLDDYAVSFQSYLYHGYTPNYSRSMRIFF